MSAPRPNKRVARPSIAWALLWAAALVIGFLAAPAFAERGELAAQVAEAERLAREAEVAAREAQTRARAAVAAEQALSEQLASIGPEIVSRQARLDEARDALHRLRRDVAEARARLAEAERDLSRLSSRALIAAREPAPALLANPNRPLEAARSATLMRALSERLRIAAARARFERDSIETAIQTARGVERAAKTQLEALWRDDVRARDLLEERQRLRDRARAVAAEAETAAQDALRRSAEAERLRAESRAEASVGGGSAPAQGGIETSALPPRSAPVREGGPLRHRSMARPVAGRVSRSARAGSNVLYFDARPYAQVIAPVRGRVMFVREVDTEGLMVIIEPQTGYQVLLSGLATSTLSEHDVVERGEPIGRMGGPAPTSDEFLFEVTRQTSQVRERLYFQVWEHRRAVDPAVWLSLPSHEVTGL